jgi:hypothetical protein
MTTAGRTHNGGTGITVITIHSGLEYLGSIPIILHSSSVIRLNISNTRSAVKYSSLLESFQIAFNSSPLRFIFG